MSQPHTLNVKQLIFVLKDLQKRYGSDAKVFIARDEEGNGYGTVEAEFSFGFDDKKNTLVIYPSVQVLEY